MEIPVIVHRWFHDEGEAWAFNPSLKSILPQLRHALKGRANGPEGRVGPIELPDNCSALAGIRFVDPERASDEFGRALSVLAIAVLPRAPMESDFEELDVRLRSLALPGHPGLCESLHVQLPINVFEKVDSSVTSSECDSTGEDIKSASATGGSTPIVGKRRSRVLRFMLSISLSVGILLLSVLAVVGFPMNLKVMWPLKKPEPPSQQSESEKRSMPQKPENESLSATELRIIDEKFHAAIDGQDENEGDGQAESLLSRLNRLNSATERFDDFVREQPLAVIQSILMRLSQDREDRRKKFGLDQMSSILANDCKELQEIRHWFIRALDGEPLAQSVEAEFEEAEAEMRIDVFMARHSALAAELGRFKANLRNAYDGNSGEGNGNYNNIDTLIGGIQEDMTQLHSFIERVREQTRRKELVPK